MHTKEGGLGEGRKEAGRLRAEHRAGKQERNAWEAPHGTKQAPAATATQAGPPRHEGGAEGGGREESRPALPAPLRPAPPSRGRRAGAGGRHGRDAVVGPTAGWQLRGGLVRGQLHHRARHRRVLQHGARWEGRRVRGPGTGAGCEGGSGACPGTVPLRLEVLRGSRRGSTSVLPDAVPGVTASCAVSYRRRKNPEV